MRKTSLSPKSPSHNGSSNVSRVASASSSPAQSSRAAAVAAAAKITTSRRRSQLVAFGRNYYYAMGGMKESAFTPFSTDHNESQHPMLESSVNDFSVSEASGLTSTMPFTFYEWEDQPRWEGANNSKKRSLSNWEDEDVAQVVCSHQSTLFLLANGKIFQTGTLHGQIYKSPLQVIIPMPLKCVEIAAGRHFCLARMEGGLATLSWGAGHFGQLGVGSGLSPSSNTSSDDHHHHHPITFAKHPIIIERLLPQMVGSPIDQIAAGDWHALALSRSGRVWAWGSNRSQQCGRKPANKPGSTSNQAPTITLPLPVPLDVAVRQIAAGRSHSAAISRETGQLYCWGSSNHGQCGNSIRRNGVAPPRLVEGLPDLVISQVAAGGNHTVALTTGGRVFVWGSGSEGELGLGPMIPSQPKPRMVADLDFVAIAAGQDWKLKQQRERNMESSSRSTPSGSISPLSNLPRISRVYACMSYSAAVSSVGHVYVWGSNDAGQLGIPAPDVLPIRDNSTGQIPPKTTTTRELHVQTFDSKHNVLLPTRLDAVSHLRVTMLACGPNHMYCVGEERDDDDDSSVVIGRTLYEVQEEERLRKLQRSRQSAASPMQTSLMKMLNANASEDTTSADFEDTTVATDFEDRTIASMDSSVLPVSSWLFMQPRRTAQGEVLVNATTSNPSCLADPAPKAGMATPESVSENATLSTSGIAEDSVASAPSATIDLIGTCEVANTPSTAETRIRLDPPAAVARTKFENPRKASSVPILSTANSSFDPAASTPVASEIAVAVQAGKSAIAAYSNVPYLSPPSSSPTPHVGPPKRMSFIRRLSAGLLRRRPFRRNSMLSNGSSSQAVPVVAESRARRTLDNAAVPTIHEEEQQASWDGVTRRRRWNKRFSM